MPPFLEAWVGAIVWAVANVVYVGLRRRGDRSFGRILSFFAGMPTTWIALFAVPEGRATRIESPPDDEDRLLREIRTDRELRNRRASQAPEPNVRGESEQPPGS